MLKLLGGRRPLTNLLELEPGHRAGSVVHRLGRSVHPQDEVLQAAAARCLLPVLMTPLLLVPRSSAGRRLLELQRPHDHNVVAHELFAQTSLHQLGGQGVLERSPR